MAVKYFTNERNQEIWDQYVDSKMTESLKKLSEKNMKKFNEGKTEKLKTTDELIRDAQTSINQYKPAPLEIERTTGKCFEDVTAEELQNFLDTDMGKTRRNHVTGFYVTIITLGLISPSKELMASLIPAEYRVIARKLLD